MTEEAALEIPDRVRKLRVQIDLEGFSVMMRESMASIIESKTEFAEAIGERKELIDNQLKESAAAVTEKVKTFGLNDKTPSREINELRHCLRYSGSEAFLDILDYEVNTFLGIFFPLHSGSQTNRWSKEDIEVAYSEAVCLNRVFAALCGDVPWSKEILTLMFSAGEMEKRLATCDYDAESQYAQLKMAEMQLVLAKNQDAMAREQQRIARSTERQSRWMTIMTIVIMVATLITLGIAIWEFFTSSSGSIDRSLQILVDRVSGIEAVIA